MALAGVKPYRFQSVAGVGLGFGFWLGLSFGVAFTLSLGLALGGRLPSVRAVPPARLYFWFRRSCRFAFFEFINYIPGCCQDHYCHGPRRALFQTLPQPRGFRGCHCHLVKRAALVSGRALRLGRCAALSGFGRSAFLCAILAVPLSDPGFYRRAPCGAVCGLGGVVDLNLRHRLPLPLRPARQGRRVLFLAPAFALLGGAHLFRRLAPALAHRLSV